MRLTWKKRKPTEPGAQPAQPETVEMSPEFTDSARAAIAWVLWHHQGGNSPTGQPLRFALGMGAHERLPEWRINEAKRWAEWAHATTADFHKYESAQPAQDAEAKDSARLNWLDRVGFTTCNEHGREPSNVHSWRDGTALKWTAHWVGSEYPTARAAIDAAMAREAGE